MRTIDDMLVAKNFSEQEKQYFDLVNKIKNFQKPSSQKKLDLTPEQITQDLTTKQQTYHQLEKEINEIKENQASSKSTESKSSEVELADFSGNRLKQLEEDLKNLKNEISKLSNEKLNLEIIESSNLNYAQLISHLEKSTQEFINSSATNKVSVDFIRYVLALDGFTDPQVNLTIKGFIPQYGLKLIDEYEINVKKEAENTEPKKGEEDEVFLSRHLTQQKITRLFDNLLVIFRELIGKGDFNLLTREDIKEFFNRLMASPLLMGKITQNTEIGHSIILAMYLVSTEENAEKLLAEVKKLPLNATLLDFLAFKNISITNIERILKRLNEAKLDSFQTFIRLIEKVPPTFLGEVLSHTFTKKILADFLTTNPIENLVKIFESLHSQVAKKTLTTKDAELIILYVGKALVSTYQPTQSPNSNNNTEDAATFLNIFAGNFSFRISQSTSVTSTNAASTILEAAEKTFRDISTSPQNLRETLLKSLSALVNQYSSFAEKHTLFKTFLAAGFSTTKLPFGELFELLSKIVNSLTPKDLESSSISFEVLSFIYAMSNNTARNSIGNALLSKYTQEALKNNPAVKNVAPEIAALKLNGSLDRKTLKEISELIKSTADIDNLAPILIALKTRDLIPLLSFPSKIETPSENLRVLLITLKNDNASEQTRFFLIKIMHAYQCSLNKEDNKSNIEKIDVLIDAMIAGKKVDATSVPELNNLLVFYNSSPLVRQDKMQNAVISPKTIPSQQTKPTESTELATMHRPPKFLVASVEGRAKLAEAFTNGLDPDKGLNITGELFELLTALNNPKCTFKEEASIPVLLNGLLKLTFENANTSSRIHDTICQQRGPKGWSQYVEVISQLFTNLDSKYKSNLSIHNQGLLIKTLIAYQTVVESELSNMGFFKNKDQQKQTLSELKSLTRMVYLGDNTNSLKVNSSLLAKFNVFNFNSYVNLIKEGTQNNNDNDNNNNSKRENSSYSM